MGVLFGHIQIGVGLNRIAVAVDKIGGFFPQFLIGAMAGKTFG
jgi:hypothetical protein